MYRTECKALIEQIERVLEQYHSVDSLFQSTDYKLWNIYDAICKQDLFTKENYNALFNLVDEINSHIRFKSEYNEAIGDYTL